MKNLKLKSFICAMAFCAFFSSCEKEYEAEDIPGNNLSGEWYVQTYFGGTAPANIVVTYTRFLTYNTAAANGSEIWVDDGGNIWPFKVRVNANPDANSFSGTGPNARQADTTQVTVIEGRVFPDGGRSITGVQVDSIYLRCSFSEDPGNEYIFAGHYRTGFLEDEP